MIKRNKRCCVGIFEWLKGIGCCCGWGSRGCGGCVNVGNRTYKIGGILYVWLINQLFFDLLFYDDV
ncbi:hypothetical protein, partial [Staphylococcus capitis]|uniref:hypothetical protein n=1 Tax=Staphylococcus capitis TaxID=29388 RepID=UPI0021B1B9EF